VRDGTRSQRRRLLLRSGLPQDIQQAADGIRGIKSDVLGDI
jgi:hypothetical protein